MVDRRSRACSPDQPACLHIAPADGIMPGDEMGRGIVASKMNEPVSVTTSTESSGPAQVSAWIKAVTVLALVGGTLAVLVGLLAGLVYLLFVLLPVSVIGHPPPGSVVVSYAVAVLGITLGGGLVFQGISALNTGTSSPLRVPSPILFVLAFVVILALGAIAPNAVRDSKLMFPTFYFLGILLPILAILSYSQRGLRRQGLSSRWRDATVQLSSGALASTAGAMLLEAAVVLLLIIFIILLVTISPGIANQWLPDLRNPRLSAGPAVLEAMLSSPIVLGLAFFVLVIAAPLIEELVKTVGVVLMMYRRPSPQQALWWGLLGGAGFALTEGLINGSVSLSQMGWSTLALVRVGTALMHCTTGGLMGLGWRSLVLERRARGWLERYVQAFLLHAVWNGLTLGLLAAPALDGARSGPPGSLQLAAIGFVALILLAEVVGLTVILRRLIANHAGEKWPSSIRMR
jgi:RsiW-degrading membrane proteinase PrsW (M82 family)